MRFIEPRGNGVSRIMIAPREQTVLLYGDPQSAPNLSGEIDGFRVLYPLSLFDRQKDSSPCNKGSLFYAISKTRGNGVSRPLTRCRGSSPIVRAKGGTGISRIMEATLAKTVLFARRATGCEPES